MEVGEGFPFVGFADGGLGADLTSREDGLDQVAPKTPDAEVAVEEVLQFKRGTSGTAGEGEAGEDGAAGLGVAATGRGVAALSREHIRAALEKLRGKTDGWC